MLGGSCNPCCGASCSAAFAHFLTQTPTVTIAGSTPGQDAATIATFYYNGDGTDYTAQDNHQVVRARAPLPGQATYYPRTVAEQRNELNSLNAYFVQYFKANGNANGTHQLSLDLASTQGTNGTGLIAFRKRTADYLLSVDITIGGGLGGGGSTTVPNVSCPIDIAVGVTQYAYSVFGIVSPSMYEATTQTFPYQAFGFGGEPFEVNATPLARWPNSEFTRLNAGATQDEQGLYSPGEFAHFWTSDMSSQNIAIGFNVLTNKYFPAESRPVNWSQVQPRTTMGYSNAGARLPESIAGKVVTYRIDGQPIGSGANKWQQITGSRSLLQPLSGESLLWAVGRPRVVYGFTTATAIPSSAGMAYLERRATAQEMSVFLNLAHP